MYLTRNFALPINFEPLVNAIVYAEIVYFDVCFTNFVVDTYILVNYFDRYFIANILYIYLKCLVPDGVFTSFVLYRCLELLLTRSNLHERIHFSNCLCVTCDASFDYCEGNNS